MKKSSDCKRTHIDFAGVESFGPGPFFVDHRGELIDSREWSVVHCGLDTVRQLYNCTPDFNAVSKIQAAYDRGFGETVEFYGTTWTVRSGGRSGYRFNLQNDDLGVNVLLCGSYTTQTTTNGPHLKIQCSPVFLWSRTAKEIQDHLTDIAELFATQITPSGVAVHICADVQGWQAPSDLDSRVTTRARRIVRRSGISDLAIGAADAAVVYGKAQSFTFGSADQLQFACYNKTKAVTDKGELPLWLPIWSQSDAFDSSVPVWRLEARFHHSVIDQFAAGSGFVANSLADLFPHLTGLWRYALNNVRLDDSASYINPFWQWARDDIQFGHSPKLDYDYQRKYKAAKDGQPSDRSLSICFGQLCSIYRKRRLTFAQASACLVNSGLFDLLLDMYRRRGKSDDDLMVTLAEKIEALH